MSRLRYQGPAQLEDGRLTHYDEDVLLALQDRSSCGCCVRCNSSLCCYEDPERCVGLGCELDGSYDD